MIRKIIFSMICVLIFSPVYGTYLFISSNPPGAKVSIITEKDKPEVIGITPLKSTNFTESTKIILERVDYFVQTNTIPSSTKVQSCNFVLSPFSFDIQFTDPTQQPVIKANGVTYTNLESTLTLPFGNYEFDYSKQNGGAFSVEYKSPYVPYIIFFSSVSVVATALAITGGILAKQHYQKFTESQTSDEFVQNMANVATWDTITWSSVGIGTGALIGTIIASSLDARDRRRIKRFNGMNSPSQTSTYFSEFQEIVFLSIVDDNEALKKISAFIRKYPKDISVLLQDIYIRRASIYVNQKKYRQAISDLKIVVDEYPTRATYELSTKLLGEIYLELKDYKNAYEYLTEALIVQDTYTIEEIQEFRLEALFMLAKTNRSYQELFLEETRNLQKISKEFRDRIDERRKEFL